MRFVTSAAILALAALPFVPDTSADTLRTTVLRTSAIDAGLVPPDRVTPNFSPERSAAGRLLFNSTTLSLTQQTSCATCHIDRFGSADGLPIGIGTGGTGEGSTRVAHGGDILPRNTLPLWGRGGKGFDVFFWDGKVFRSDQARIRSQFGENPPSSDPLVVAVHLPMVEIREMIPDTKEIDGSKTETLASARAIYRLLEQEVQRDISLSTALSNTFNIDPSEITIHHVALCLADFIRDRFRLRETKFHQFVFGHADLSPDELRGGLLFYGKAGCAACHNGPYFSDLAFHAIPFTQIGFGKNGFGVDYGRFNVTLDPADRYKFRTPPLINVTRTAPYSHSGSTFDLAASIRSHVDPLAGIRVEEMTGEERIEFYSRMAMWTNEPLRRVYLDQKEITDLVAFLGTLQFDD